MFQTDTDVHRHILAQQTGPADVCDCRRYGPSFVIVSTMAVDGYAIQPIPHTLLLAVLYVALARGVQLRAKSKTNPPKQPSSVFENQWLHLVTTVMIRPPTSYRLAIFVKAFC